MGKPVAASPGIADQTAGYLTGSENAGDFTVKFLVIVNESPWGSTLALAAWRFVRAAIDSKIQASAVFFHEDGIYNALEGEAGDAGTPNLAVAWTELAELAGVRLLLCSSSLLRRLDEQPSAAFETSGLTQLVELMLHNDRVVTF